MSVEAVSEECTDLKGNMSRETHNSSSAKHIDRRALFRQEAYDNVEGEPDICQSEPGEEQRDRIELTKKRCWSEPGVQASYATVCTHKCLDMQEEHSIAKSA